jgi:hypothetical protein
MELMLIRIRQTDADPTRTNSDPNPQLFLNVINILIQWAPCLRYVDEFRDTECRTKPRDFFVWKMPLNTVHRTYGNKKYAEITKKLRYVSLGFSTGKLRKITNCDSAIVIVAMVPVRPCVPPLQADDHSYVIFN